MVTTDAPKDQKFIIGPTPQLEQPYTADCDSVGNPPPVCTWWRESLLPLNRDEDDDGGSANDINYNNVIPITSDVEFTNNGCTIHIPRYIVGVYNALVICIIYLFRLMQVHSGHYLCNATNFLGTGLAGLPTIIFNGKQHLYIFLVLATCH